MLQLHTVDSITLFFVMTKKPYSLIQEKVCKFISAATRITVNLDALELLTVCPVRATTESL